MVCVSLCLGLCVYVSVSGSGSTCVCLSKRTTSTGKRSQDHLDLNAPPGIIVLQGTVTTKDAAVSRIRSLIDRLRGNHPIKCLRFTRRARCLSSANSPPSRRPPRHLPRGTMHCQAAVIKPLNLVPSSTRPPPPLPPTRPPWPSAESAAMPIHSSSSTRSIPLWHLRRYCAYLTQLDN